MYVLQVISFGASCGIRTVRKLSSPAETIKMMIISFLENFSLKAQRAYPTISATHDKQYITYGLKLSLRDVIP